MTKIFIPYYMIETGEARREFPVFATEMSVFYHWGIDWVQFRHDRRGWSRFKRENRN